MITASNSTPVLVIGAGSSGLAAIKNLRAAGIPYDCLERNDDVGGNWYYGRPNSSVYSSTHLISSKRLTEYTDFPMPAEWPDYPSRQQAFAYLQSYARHFELYDTIEFNRSVERVERTNDSTGLPWRVTLHGGETRHYRRVIIANGHNWDPRWPDYPGHFAGQVLHSCQYKTPDVLAGRRVLVVGGGNSGCDIAVESAQHAEQTFHSLRRGYHYLPKFVRGKPIDQIHERYLRWGVPLPVRRWVSGIAARLILGRPERWGLPRPDHRLFESHPIINSQMLYYAAHGRIQAKPDIAELCGEQVRFVDGTQAAIDVIVYATGYKVSFPFIDTSLLHWRDGRPDLYLNVFHPEHDELFVIGLIQPDSGQWGLVDRQAQLVAKYLHAIEQGLPAAEKLRQLKQRAEVDLGNGIDYVRSPRHLLEVEHYSYRRRLERELQAFG